MILLIVFVGAVVIGLLRGGRLSRMIALPLRWPGLSLLALVAQLLVVYFPEPQRQGFLSPRAGLLLASYLALLLMLWLNRRISGVALLALGLVLNLAVMLANGGYMPITPQSMQQIGHQNVASFTVGSRVPMSKDIALPQEQTRLWALSDVLVLPRPFPVPSAFSVGDVLIGVGAFLVVQQALLGRLPVGVRRGSDPSSPRRGSGPDGSVVVFRGRRVLPANYRGEGHEPEGAEPRDWYGAA